MEKNKSQSPVTDEKFIKHCDDVLEGFEYQGLAGYLIDFESAENIREIDPVLYDLWREFEDLAVKIKGHLETAGGRRENEAAVPEISNRQVTEKIEGTKDE